MLKLFRVYNDSHHLLTTCNQFAIAAGADEVVMFLPSDSRGFNYAIHAPAAELDSIIEALQLARMRLQTHPLPLGEG